MCIQRDQFNRHEEGGHDHPPSQVSLREEAAQVMTEVRKGVAPMDPLLVTSAVSVQWAAVWATPQVGQSSVTLTVASTHVTCVMICGDMS